MTAAVLPNAHRSRSARYGLFVTKRRIFAVLGVATIMWGAATTAAFADEVVPVDPPPVAEPPPADPSPAPTRDQVPVPDSEPLTEIPSSVPQGTFDVPHSLQESDVPPAPQYLTLQQQIAAHNAFVNEHMDALNRLMASLKPGQSLSIELDGTVSIVGPGPVDLATKQVVSLGDYGEAVTSVFDLTRANEVEEQSAQPQTLDTELTSSTELTSITAATGPSELVLLAFVLTGVAGYRLLLGLRRKAAAAL